MAVLDGVLRHVPDEAAAALPGARELIEAARDRGTPLAIVTSAGPAWVERSLVESLGLSLTSVDVVVTARDVVDGKPHPAGFALACERLGADPARAVAARYSPACVRAAIGAGVRHVHGSPPPTPARCWWTRVPSRCTTTSARCWRCSRARRGASTARCGR